MDSWLESDYESRQGADVDDLDGFEFGFEDETEDDDGEFPFDDDDEPMPQWPSDEEKRDAELYQPVPLTDDEMAQIQADWDRYRYMTEMLNEHLDR